MILRDPNTNAGIGQWSASEAYAHSSGIAPVNASITSEVEWVAEISMRDADGGMRSVSERF